MRTPSASLIAVALVALALSYLPPWTARLYAAIGTPSLLDSGSSVVADTSYQTNTIAPSANALLIVEAWAIDAFPSEVPAVTVSGLSLTWTDRSSQEFLGVARLVVQTAVTGASPGTGPITISCSPQVGGILYRVVEITGVNTTTPVVQSAGATETNAVNLSTFASAGNGTYAVAFGEDDDGTSQFTAGSGFTRLGSTGYVDSGNTGLGLVITDQYRTDPDTTVDVGVSGSLQAHGIIAMEIAAADGGGEPEPEPPMLWRCLLLRVCQ